MKGLICYFSGSGNTRLACEAIAARIASAEVELHDITNGAIPDLAGYGLVGVATWADFGDPSRRIGAFIESLPRQEGKPAFVFNTYGAFSGRTLATLHRRVGAKGFRVIAGHSLHVPENYPPMIQRGQAFADAPNAVELAAFGAFTVQLDALAKRLSAGEQVPPRRIGLGRFMPAFSRTHGRRAMGEKLVDTEACTECGTCRDRCPYGAITLDPQPVFDEDQCNGCWACYNHCPTQAISTRKVRGVPQYARPGECLRFKLEK